MFPGPGGAVPLHAPGAWRRQWKRQRPGGDGDRWGLEGGLQEGLTCRDHEQG